MPPLLAFTDPVRTPDLTALVARLPRGAGVVYRAFGSPDARQTARALVRLARARGVRVFIGADAQLAAAARADGVHLPERLSNRAGEIARLKGRFWVTAAAHSLPAMRRAAVAGAQALIVSPVFPSQSPSAGRPLGTLRFARLARGASVPVYALGGVNGSTVRALAHSGAAGVAAIGGLG